MTTDRTPFRGPAAAAPASPAGWATPFAPRWRPARPGRATGAGGRHSGATGNRRPGAPADARPGRPRAISARPRLRARAAYSTGGGDDAPWTPGGSDRRFSSAGPMPRRARRASSRPWLWTAERHATLAGSDHRPIHREGDRTTMFHRDEPIPGQEGLRTRVRRGLAEPRDPSSQRAWLRRIPPAGRTVRNEDHTLYASHTGVGVGGGLPRLDPQPGVSRRPQGCRQPRRPLSRTAAVEGFTVLQTVARAGAEAD